MNLEELDKKLSVHEAVCVERYNHIIERQEWFQKKIDKVERMIIIVMVLVVALNPKILEMILKVL